MRDTRGRKKSKSSKEFASALLIPVVFFFLFFAVAASTPSRRFVRPNSLAPDGAGNRNQNLLTSTLL